MGGHCGKSGQEITWQTPQSVNSPQGTFLTSSRAKVFTRPTNCPHMSLWPSIQPLDNNGTGTHYRSSLDLLGKLSILVICSLQVVEQTV